MLTEDDIVVEDLDNRADTYGELYNSLAAYTNDFTKEQGAYPASNKVEVENVINILKQAYNNVRRSTDVQRASAEMGADYKVYFSEPKEEITSNVGESLGESLTEAIEKHDDLNDDLFDGDHLDPEVRDKMLEVVEKFIDNLNVDKIELEPIDIIMVGSNASYNYTDASDVDLHIVADTSIYGDHDDLALKLYNAYKQLFNNKYSPTIYGHELEIYVEPEETTVNSNGIYSVMNDEWVKVPEKENIPEPDMEEVERLLQPYIERARDADTIEDIDQLIDDLYIERQRGILNSGEYDIGNLVFKEARNIGLLKELKDKKVELENEQMSLESLGSKYRAFDLHEAMDHFSRLDESIHYERKEMSEPLKRWVNEAIDMWFEKWANASVRKNIATFADIYFSGGGAKSSDDEEVDFNNPLDVISAIENDQPHLVGIITDYAMGDFDMALTIGDYVLGELNKRVNGPEVEDDLTEDIPWYDEKDPNARFTQKQLDMFASEIDRDWGDDLEVTGVHLDGDTLSVDWRYSGDYDNHAHTETMEIDDDIQSYWELRNRYAATFRSRIIHKVAEIRKKDAEISRSELNDMIAGRPTYRDRKRMGLENESLTEDEDSWNEGNGERTLDYKGFTIVDNGSVPDWMIDWSMPNGYLVDFGYDTEVFDSVEDAKAAIDSEIEQAPEGWYESFSEDINEAKDKWIKTPYGFSEMEYKGFVISKHDPDSFMYNGYPFSVDFYGDEAGFENLEDAKAAIDDELSNNPESWPMESLDESSIDKLDEIEQNLMNMKVGDSVTVKNYKNGDIYKFVKKNNGNQITAFENVNGKNHLASPQHVFGWAKDSLIYSGFEPKFESGSVDEDFDATQLGDMGSFNSDYMSIDDEDALVKSMRKMKDLANKDNPDDKYEMPDWRLQ